MAFKWEEDQQTQSMRYHQKKQTNKENTHHKKQLLHQVPKVFTFSEQFLPLLTKNYLDHLFMLSLS